MIFSILFTAETFDQSPVRTTSGQNQEMGRRYSNLFPLVVIIFLILFIIIIISFSHRCSTSTICFLLSGTLVRSLAGLLTSFLSLLLLTSFSLLPRPLILEPIHSFNPHNRVIPSLSSSLPTRKRNEWYLHSLFLSILSRRFFRCLLHKAATHSRS